MHGYITRQGIERRHARRKTRTAATAKLSSFDPTDRTLLDPRHTGSTHTTAVRLSTPVYARKNILSCTEAPSTSTGSSPTGAAAPSPSIHAPPCTLTNSLHPSSHRRGLSSTNTLPGKQLDSAERSALLCFRLFQLSQSHDLLANFDFPNSPTLLCFLTWGNLIEERVSFSFFCSAACICVFRIFLWLYGRLQNLIAPYWLASAGGGFFWGGIGWERAGFCIALLWWYSRGEASSSS